MELWWPLESHFEIDTKESQFLIYHVQHIKPNNPWYVLLFSTYIVSIENMPHCVGCLTSTMYLYGSMVIWLLRPYGLENIECRIISSHTMYRLLLQALKLLTCSVLNALSGNETLNRQVLRCAHASMPRCPDATLDGVQPGSSVHPVLLVMLLLMKS